MDFHKTICHLEDNLEIWKRLFSSIDIEDVTWKPEEDRWSFLEILCHLVDIEREDFPVDLDIILFHPHDPWPSFSIMDWVTSRQYNQQNYEEKIEEFVKERFKSIQWLKSLEAPDLSKRHSGNGFKREPLCAGDVLSSWLAHDHFHYRQFSLLYFDLLESGKKSYSPLYSGFER